MIKTKLTELLRTFSKKEFKEFEKFIRSPYFNKGRDLLPFYKSLEPFYPNFNEQNFTVENIFKVLYPHTKFQSKKSLNIIRVLSSDMMQLGREFLKQEELKSQKLAGGLIELKSLRKRNLKNLYSKHYAKILKDCDSLTIPESDFYLEFHQIHKDSCKVLEINRARDFQDMELLFNYFLFESAKFIFGKEGEQKNHKEIFSNNFIYNFFKFVDPEKFLTLLNESNMSKKSKDLISYYTNFIVFSLNPGNEIRLEKFKESFFKVRKYLGKDIKYMSYSAINQYYTVNINLPELNKLFKNLLEDEIFGTDPDQYMHYLAFRGIFRNFMEIGKEGEAPEFLEKYKNYLHPDFRQQMYDLCVAELEVRNKNYKKALDHILKIEISTFFLKYDIRNLLLKIYYYMDHFEEARYLLQSYKKFLTGNKSVQDEAEKRLLVFLNFYEKLFKLKLSGNKKEIEKFKAEFENVSQNSMWFKIWLKEEINVLLN